MVKLILLLTLIFVLFIVENKEIQKGKMPTQYTKVISILHIVSGIAITLFATVHGIGHMQNATDFSLITGMIVLILLYMKIIIGIILKKRINSSNQILKIIQKIIIIIVIGSTILHVLLRKVA